MSSNQTNNVNQTNSSSSASTSMPSVKRQMWADITDEDEEKFQNLLCTSKDNSVPKKEVNSSQVKSIPRPQEQKKVPINPWTKNTSAAFPWRSAEKPIKEPKLVKKVIAKVKKVVVQIKEKVVESVQVEKKLDTSVKVSTVESNPAVSQSEEQFSEDSPQELSPKLLYEKIVHQNNPYVSTDIRLTDTLGSLRLYHYVYCDRDSDDAIKNCRGIVREDDTIVCKTFKYTDEYLVSEKELIDARIHSFNQCKFYDGEEGATLRLFFYKGKWILSTHRKLDAFRSKWGNPRSKSFGQMFIDGLKFEVVSGSLQGKVNYDSSSDNSDTQMFDSYCSSLDQNKTYCFLVRNSAENRIVCDALEHPQIYFVGSFERSTHLLVEGNDSGISMPQEHKFQNLDELLQYVDNIDHKKKTSIIVYMPNQQQFKITNARYLDYFKARGNEPSIKFRYLQIRLDRDMVALLYSLYPEEITNFENYENILEKISKRVEQSYVKRYIPSRDGSAKTFVSLPQPQFFIMQACHNWHISDRANNKVSIDKIHEVIDNQSAESLNKLIKSFLQAEAENSEDKAELERN